MKNLTRQEELILLAVFQLKDNAYLVTIRDYLISVADKNFSIGAVYVPLNRLKKLGYLNTRIGEPNAKRGPNEIQYYELSYFGVQALKEIQKLNDIIWAGFDDFAFEQK